ncbi:MAG: hypothetical protein HYT79_01260 [Elusimicrobia bacterium]|nr:hypothetical protein [Elusimicrobiota bacterium]
MAKFFIFVLGIVLAGVPLSGGELQVSFGPANYEVEGAGPGGHIWEEKPSYENRPYMEVEYQTRFRENPVVHQTYKKFKWQYLDGQRRAMSNQQIRRRVETMNVSAGWGWVFPTGLGFELGPILLSQRHRLDDLVGDGRQSHSTVRLGTYFSSVWFGHRGPWKGEFAGSIGVAGWPDRQSVYSELMLSLARSLGGGPWSMGVKYGGVFWQFSRDANLTGNVGSFSDAVVLFKNTETDAKLLMLSVSRRIK